MREAKLGDYVRYVKVEADEFGEAKSYFQCSYDRVTIKDGQRVMIGDGKFMYYESSAATQYDAKRCVCREELTDGDWLYLIDL